MSESNRDVELPRIKRKTDSWEGMVIRYLLSYPSKKPATELAMDALTPYWLPLALKERGVKGRELKSTGRKAIAQLMQQIEIIRLECGLRPDEMPFGEFLRLSPPVVPTPGVTAPTATAPPPTVVENTGDGDDEEDEDGDDEDEDEEFDSVIDDDFFGDGTI